MRWAFLLLVPAVFLLWRPTLLGGIEFSEVYVDLQGKPLRLTITSDQKYRVYTRLADISPMLVDVMLLQEDQHFRRHFGVNVFSVGRAAWSTLTGDRRIGASTITMQLARLRFGIHSRSVFGKLHQLFRALQLEIHYSKDEILEAYANLAPFGGNVEGVGAASWIYFRKRPRSLDLSESMTLAVIPKSPARRDPASGKPWLQTARDELFQRWKELNPGNEVAYAPPLGTRAELPFRAPHFVDAIRHTKAAGEIPTTLDGTLQKLVETQVASYLESRKTRGLFNATVLLVDWRTMEVRAHLGSADFFDRTIHGQVNGARGRRSPGSTLKPFLYALGIDQGLVHPRTLLKDTVSYFADYDPENFEKDFVGPITVKDALIRSRNVPAVQLANRLKPGLYSFLKDAGVRLDETEGHYGLALTLGAAEMTMEEILRLYAMLGNGGLLKPLRYLKSDPQPDGVRLLSPEATFLVLDILRENPRPDQPFRREWLRSDVPVAWKTGTSFGFRDAWTFAVFGPYAIGVWIGNFDGRPNPDFIGRDAAAPLLFRITDAIRAEKNLKPEAFAYDSKKIKRVGVCSVSGDLPGPFCPRTTSTWFIPGKSPIRTCAIHRRVLIDEKTGLRACGPERVGVRAETYEFWPSDLAKLFRLAGLTRRSPPALDPACSLDARSSRGIPPEITSPRREIGYQLRADLLGTESVPFTATSDADTRTLYWFVDEKFVGKSESSETFFWNASPGHYLVRVVDDQGRADAREIKVELVQ